MRLRFVTKNRYKVDEVQKILTSVEIIHSSISIKEIQTDDINEIVKDKIIKAFKIVGHPVFIEHTSLYLSGLNDFPGGLTQVFWDKLQADKFADLINKTGDNSAIAKTLVAYCDGKNIHSFEGTINGNISHIPKGNREFQWDCVFIPENYNYTFAEMGEKKNNISMRKIAFEKFNDFLRKVVI